MTEKKKLSLKNKSYNKLDKYSSNYQLKKTFKKNTNLKKKNIKRQKKIKYNSTLNKKKKSFEEAKTINNILNKKIKNIKNKQTAGSGQGNQGHDVSMPIQYFGKELNRYFPTGSPELIPPPSSYGPTIATSHGVSIPGNDKFVGPDLGPFNSAIGISGIQTGGKVNKKKKGGNQGLMSVDYSVNTNSSKNMDTISESNN